MRRTEIAHYLEHPPNCLHLNESFRPALFSKCDKRRKTRRKSVVVFLSFVLKEEQGRRACVHFFFTRFFFTSVQQASSASLAASAIRGGGVSAELKKGRNLHARSHDQWEKGVQPTPETPQRKHIVY